MTALLQIGRCRVNFPHEIFSACLVMWRLIRIIWPLVRLLWLHPLALCVVPKLSKNFIACGCIELSPRVGPGYPLSAFAPFLSIRFLIFCSLLPYPFPFLIHFTYFLLLSIRSLSTRIVPYRFQA